MTKVKKSIAFMLTAILALSLFSAVPFTAAQAEGTDGNWVCAWSTSPIDASLSELGLLDDVGLMFGAISSRVTITPAASGSQVRLTFSNEYGLTPLTISVCTVAKTGKDSKTIQTATLEKVKFGGKTIYSIPAGKVVTSDPVDFEVTAGEKITVTTYFRGLNVQRTIGLIGGDTYAAVGNFTRIGSMALGIPLCYSADSGDYQAIPSFKGLDVLSSDPDASVCVFFGDSTIANEIPRLLEQKLLNNGVTNVSVTQEAIKGNRLVADGVGKAAKLLGASGLERFENDVLAQAGVKYVVVKLGINDVVHPYCASKSDALDPVPLEEMIAGYKELVDMAHAAGVEIYFAELTPWEGYTRNVFGAGDDVQFSQEIDKLRQDINAWFASDECPADGYINLDGMADPADAYALNPAYTPDGIHYTAEGQAKFVELFPIDIFA